MLEETDLTPTAGSCGGSINIDARLQALKISFLVLASVAVLAIVPAGGLPDYTPQRNTRDKPRIQRRLVDERSIILGVYDRW